MHKVDDKTLQMYIWLQLACGADSLHPFKLLCHFGNIESVYTADDYSTFDLPDKVVTALYNKRLNTAFELLKRCNALGVTVICLEDKRYPKKLRKIKNPPVVLYCKGKFIDMDTTLCVGMVGTRKMADYARKTAQYLASGVANSGAVVISGVAKGIDGVCQQTALNEGGFTVGVLGTAIDTIYPKENAALFNRLYRQGLVISEYWPGCVTGKQSFHNRNRIIAGLSDVVVVVAAPAVSGAIITADYAIKQGKQVCVPTMPPTAENAGTVSLAQRGAKLISSVADLLAEYEASLPNGIAPDAPLPSSKDDGTDYNGSKGTAAEEKELAYNFLLDELEQHGPETLQQAASKTTRFTVRELMAAASMLELDGFIEKTPGGCFIAVPAKNKLWHKEQ